MGTAHEKAARVMLDDMLRDPDAASELARVRQHLATPGKYSPEFVAAVGQIFRLTPAHWPAHQAACFLKVHFGVLAGRYARLTVEVGRQPAADAQRASNAEALDDLPRPFVAALDMDQNGADQDGALTWNEEVTAVAGTATFFYTDCCSVPVTRSERLPAAEMPLEVGHSLPSRTLTHLEMDGGVARWPYGSTDLEVLLNTEHPLLS
ncbi:hypothetical protein ACIRL3_46155 [Streptomyces sp. NPDC102384]|uniref:hypothetical protein n=1 Tax=unclassified Streptomyces TaxID=2593676 RepID=UPI003830E489